MRPRPSPDTPAWSLPDNLDLQLLRDAQADLQCRDRRQAPSEVQERAWEWFHQSYEPLLRHWLMGCHIAADDVKDCLQEVWMEVMKKLPAFDSNGTQRGLCSWLHTIVHGKAVDLLRYRSRHPSKRLNGRAEAMIVERHAGPEAACGQRARQKAVQEILAALDKQVSRLTYAAFYKHCIEGQTLKQIAAELNLTERKVWCRIYQAKRKFRLLCNQPAHKDLLDDG